jgi:hypothetical protein
MHRAPRGWLPRGVLALALVVLPAIPQGFARETALFVVPLRRSEDSIRVKVLQQTPLGSSKREVLAFIAHRLQKDEEPELQDSGARRVTYGADAVDEQVGVSSIERLEVGHYGILRYLLVFKTYVFLSWAFDADDRLIDVIVYKESDLP